MKLSLHSHNFYIRKLNDNSWRVTYTDTYFKDTKVYKKSFSSYGAMDMWVWGMADNHDDYRDINERILRKLGEH